ncbi:MAG: hypothetical protein PHU85_10115 [Phycisphaerae bacterium]|nr:hypothetical protein [Phycisphaerae bacterium]
MTNVRRQQMQFLRRFAQQRLLKSTGRGVKVSDFAEEKLKAEPGWMERGLAFTAAMAASPHWQAEPLAGSDLLGDFACRVMDTFAGEMIKHCSRPVMPPSFDATYLAPTIELLTPRASARQVTRWRRAADAVARLSESFLLRKRAAWGKPGPYTGCGPNHLFIIASSLWRIGRLLGQARYRRVAQQALRKMCDLQAADGYFPEHSGPAVGYHRPSVFGLCLYFAASGDRFVLPYIERGVEFAARALYPDLTPIETLDQRNRLHAHIGTVGGRAGAFDAAFGLTPLGRRLAQRIMPQFLDRVEQHPDQVPLSGAAIIALAALVYRDGPTARRLPTDRAAYVDRFDRDAAGIVRRDGWTVALSGYHGWGSPGNPFILERTQNISVFSDRFGLVIGGGNDKNRVDTATFDLAESGYSHYFPPVGGRVRVAAGEGKLDLDYGAAQTQLRAVIRSPKLLELHAGAMTTFGYQEDTLNLQIPVGVGGVRIDGRPIKLSKDATDPDTWPVKRWFEPIPGVRIETPGGAKFRWPHLPWNSYNIPAHTSTIGAATGFLRVSLSGGKLDERAVRIRVV